MQREYRLFYNGKLIGYEWGTSEANAITKAVNRNPDHIASLFHVELIK